MIAQELSFLSASVAGAVAVLALLAMQFLRAHGEGRVVPSVMLWLDERVSPLRRILSGVFSRWKSLLAPLLALLALIFALTDPVLVVRPDAPRTVVVCAPDARKTAERLVAKLDPSRTSVLLLSGSGVFLQKNLPFAEQNVPLLPVDRDGVLALAGRLAGENGVVVWLDSLPPPRLPAGAVFQKTGDATFPVASPLKLHVKHASEALLKRLALLPGVQLTNRESATLILSSGNGTDEAEAERIYSLLTASGIYGFYENGQFARIPDTEPGLPPRGASRLSWILFVAALLAALADILLWSKRKTV